jgi:hypothetical protein
MTGGFLGPIDIERRKAAAELLRRFVDGRLTNRELERAWPRGPELGLDAIRDAVWATYDDLVEHYHASSVAADDLLGRCIDFLETEDRYVWPRQGLLARVLLGVLSLVSMGLVAHVIRRRDQFPEFWPFESEKARAMAHKRLV